MMFHLQMPLLQIISGILITSLKHKSMNTDVRMVEHLHYTNFSEELKEIQQESCARIWFLTNNILNITANTIKVNIK